MRSAGLHLGRGRRVTPLATARVSARSRTWRRGGTHTCVEHGVRKKRLHMWHLFHVMHHLLEQLASDPFPSTFIDDSERQNVGQAVRGLAQYHSAVIPDNLSGFLEEGLVVEPGNHSLCSFVVSSWSAGCSGLYANDSKSRLTLPG